MSYKIKFQTKLFIYYSLLITLIISLSLVFLYIYIANTSRDRAVENLKQLTLKTSEQIDGILENMDRVTIQIMQNPTIIQAFAKINHTDTEYQNYFETDFESSKSLKDTLLSINGPNVSVARISLFSFSGDFFNYGILPDSAAVSKDYLSKINISNYHTTLLSNSKHRIIMPPHSDFWSDSNEQMLVSILRLVKDPFTDVVYGFVETQQPASKFENVWSNLSDIEAFLFSETGEPVFPYNIEASKTGFYKEILEQSHANEKVIVYNKDNSLLSYCKLPYSGWNLVFKQSENSIYAASRVTGITMILVGISLILISLAAIFTISNQLVKPLRQLNQSIRAVSLNNLSVDISNSSNSNEIYQLNDSFNKMFSRLKTSITQEVKAHQLALQSQVNPHFLYNILSIISAAGQETGSERVPEICKKLSSMLRYTSNFSDSNITIYDELEHARNYLELMKVRYENYFEYKIKFSEETLSVKVPKLILQPILENCFQHGFSDILPPWNIEINIYTIASNWYIDVVDNGIGIEEHILERIMNKAENFTKNPSENIHDMKLGGLGLVNTIIRLKLVYTDSFIFRTDNNLPQGTKITIGGTINV